MHNPLECQITINHCRVSLMHHVSDTINDPFKRIIAKVMLYEGVVEKHLTTINQIKIIIFTYIITKMRGVIVQF